MLHKYHCLFCNKWGIQRIYNIITHANWLTEWGMIRAFCTLCLCLHAALPLPLSFSLSLSPRSDRSTWGAYPLHREGEREREGERGRERKRGRVRKRGREKKRGRERKRKKERERERVVEYVFELYWIDRCNYLVCQYLF